MTNDQSSLTHRLPLHWSLGIWSLVISARSAGVPVWALGSFLPARARMVTGQMSKVSVPVWALGSFLPSRSGWGGGVRRRCRVSVPVWALGSFLLATIAGLEKLARKSFSARVGSGVFSTGHRCGPHRDADPEWFQCPCGLWGLFYRCARAWEQECEAGFSARVGSGVFSTRHLSPRNRSPTHNRFSARVGSGVFST